MLEIRLLWMKKLNLQFYLILITFNVNSHIWLASDYWIGQHTSKRSEAQALITNSPLWFAKVYGARGINSLILPPYPAGLGLKISARTWEKSLRKKSWEKHCLGVRNPQPHSLLQRKSDRLRNLLGAWNSSRKCYPLYIFIFICVFKLISTTIETYKLFITNECHRF